MYPIKKSTILDILIFAHDANGDPVNSLADGAWTKRISKGGAASFAAMTVTITFVESGWYHLQLSASHTDTLGVLSMYFTAAGAKQVNLQYRVFTEIPDDAVIFPAGAIEFTYTLTNTVDSSPIEGAEIWVSTDVGGTNVIWSGLSDSLGVARDISNNKPMLDPMTAYFWRKKNGFSFTNPDPEIIS